jgi:hypothetical protein
MTVVKKLIAICLMAAFLVANIGCGGTTDTKKTDVKPSQTVTGETKKDTGK